MKRMEFNIFVGADSRNGFVRSEPWIHCDRGFEHAYIGHPTWKTSIITQKEVMMGALRDSTIQQVSGSCVFVDNPTTVEGSVLIQQPDRMVYKKRHSFFMTEGDNTLDADALKEVYIFLAMGFWASVGESGHFTNPEQELSSISRKCILCKVSMYLPILGYYNLIGTPRPFTSKDALMHCINPACISHKIEEMLDHSYTPITKAEAEKWAQDPTMSKLNEALHGTANAPAVIKSYEG